jgi:hypothetical protein
MICGEFSAVMEDSKERYPAHLPRRGGRSAMRDAEDHAIGS